MKSLPFSFVDLTHDLEDSIPTWDGTCGFEHKLHHNYDENQKYQFKTHRIKMHEGIGTHIDSPSHCFKDGRHIDDLTLEELITNCAVIDVSKNSHERYSCLPKDIDEYENLYGKIAPKSFVLFHTGWGKLWNNPLHYRNNLVYPSISSDAAALLMEREIVGLGIDSLSPDRQEDGFPVHHLILGSGKYIVENIANSSKMPPNGGFTVILPLKIKNGTEAPVRMIGLIPK